MRQRILIDRNVPILWSRQRDLREILRKIRLLGRENGAFSVAIWTHVHFLGRAIRSIIE